MAHAAVHLEEVLLVEALLAAGRVPSVLREVAGLWPVAGHALLRHAGVVLFHVVAGHGRVEVALGHRAAVREAVARDRGVILVVVVLVAVVCMQGSGAGGTLKK